MPAIGDVIELVHEQTYLGQVVNNVYYFQNNDVAGTLPSLAAWFENDVVAAIKLAQVDLVTHTNLRLRNLFLDAETHEEPLTGTGGLVAGVTELPSFIAMGARFDHLSGQVRPGFKRWVGMQEEAIQDALLVSTQVTRVSNICSQLIQPPATPNPGWVPVIVGRVCEELNPVIGATPVCLKYRLPNAQIELETGVPVTFEVYAQPTSQNSRKWYT